MSFKGGEISKINLHKLDIPVDNSKYINFHKYKFLISDWSGIFIEYALIFKRKAFLINTPIKMVNKDYLKYENKPIEVTMRNVLAKCYELKDIPNIINEIQLTKDKESFEDEKVKRIIYENFF